MPEKKIVKKRSCILPKLGSPAVAPLTLLLDNVERKSPRKLILTLQKEHDTSEEQLHKSTQRENMAFLSKLNHKSAQQKLKQKHLTDKVDLYKNQVVLKDLELDIKKANFIAKRTTQVAREIKILEVTNYFYQDISNNL